MEFLRWYPGRNMAENSIDLATVANCCVVFRLYYSATVLLAVPTLVLFAPILLVVAAIHNNNNINIEYIRYSCFIQWIFIYNDLSHLKLSSGNLRCSAIGRIRLERLIVRWNCCLCGRWCRRHWCCRITRLIIFKWIVIFQYVGFWCGTSYGLLYGRILQMHRNINV